MVKDSYEIHSRCINYYLDHLDNDEKRKNLKDELYYNPALNREFGERLAEFTDLVQSLVHDDSKLFHETSVAFLNREPPTNMHIIDMYRVNFEDLMQDLETQTGFSKEECLKIFNQVKLLFEKSNLYHNFPQTSSTKNKKVIKI